jgi:SNF2 family DNA or RNA helicase
MYNVLDFNFKTQPFGHQIESFRYAIENDMFFLGDEQGLGKTKQALDIAVAKKQFEGAKKCLIVCGVNGTRFNWVKEVGIHTNEKVHVLGEKIKRNGQKVIGDTIDKLMDLHKSHDEYFLLTNIETLRSPSIKKKLEEMTENEEIEMVIIDEIHKAKNAESSQGKAIHSLNSKYRLALTGTPLMNRPVDLYNILKWLGAYEGSFYGFRNKYCQMGGRGGFGIVGYKNLDDLRRRFESISLRRKKTEVLDLPEKIRTTVEIEMTPKQQQIYNDVRNYALANIQRIKLSPNPLSQLIRLRQATAHTSILSDTIHESAKMDKLKEMVEEMVENGQKALIFSNWASVINIVKNELSEYNPAVITGGTPEKDREGEVDRFQTDDDCKIAIGTINAMGTGFTMTAATNVIFLDKPWNMANTEQAEDRAHRIGTTGTVNVYTLVCTNTIDERIEEIIEEKAELSEGLVEGDWDVIARISIEDREALVDRLLY